MSVDNSDTSFVFLPYFRTSEPVTFRGIEFRNTQPTADLPEDIAKHIGTLREMFFLKDHLQIQQMIYTVLPGSDGGFNAQIQHHLREFQTLVAYLSSAPHPHSGETWLTFEHVSMYIFTPKPVFIVELLQGGHNVTNICTDFYPTADDKSLAQVDGYECTLNFKTHFRAAKGSRIYPPTCRTWFGVDNNLHYIMSLAETSSQSSLIKFFDSGIEVSQLRGRILTALTWYNRSITVDIEEDVALVNLAVAFESLLDLESGEGVVKRFGEAVNLLLGGPSRLDSWLFQFYKARSAILHEGQSANLRFLAIDEPKKKHNKPQPVYRPLVSYGRQVFQICVATILNGALLADKVGFSSMLFTNQERFERVCKFLNKDDDGPEERILAAAQDISDIARYYVVGDENLRIETLIGAAQLAAKCYLETNPSDDSEFLRFLDDFANAKRDTDYYDALSSLKNVYDILSEHKKHQIRAFHDSIISPKRISPDDIGAVFSLLNSVWLYTSFHYIYLHRNRANP